VNYDDFVDGKLSRVPPTGLSVIPELNTSLFPFQRDLVTWALRRGRCAIFADTGLGKTRQELEWARCVALATGGRVLILAPLAVGAQTVREADKIGVAAKQVRYASDIDDECPQIVVTNYDRIHHFDASAFVGVVCDESSVIKNSDSKTFATLTEMFAQTPFRLCATATPSPNDYTELGTHAEFLGICTKEEMLAEYFCHDGGETQTWRLKGHARGAFWRWVAGWAALIRKPSDLGYSDAGYDLPPLVITQHTIPADHSIASEIVLKNGAKQSLLFAEAARTLTQRRAARKATLNARVQNLVNQVTEECDLCRLRRRSALTCASTTEPTSTGGPSERPRSRPSTTPSDASSTQQTRSSARSSRLKRAVTASSTQDEHSTRISDSSDSMPTDTTASFPSRKAAAPYASGESPETDGTIDSTSTTATAPDACEDSSAPTATMALESSTTIPTDSKWPLGTCGCAKSEQWLIWVELNAEEEAIAEALGLESIAIRGSDTPERKEEAAQAWMRGDVRILISKPSIFGWGLNFQFAARMCFVGVKDSYESTYQAIRRCWRFGQTRSVHVHVFASELEGEVVKNLERKERDAFVMSEALSVETREMVKAEIMGQKRQTNAYSANTKAKVPTWM
jgi:SNF2-related domain